MALLADRELCLRHKWTISIRFCLGSVRSSCGKQTIAMNVYWVATFWPFNRTRFQSLNRVWKKIGDFITPENCALLLSKVVLRIARPKCPDDEVLWTRLRDCNTIRRVLAIHNFNILVVIWRFKELTQFRIAQLVVLPQKPFLVINSVHNARSRDEIAQ